MTGRPMTRGQDGFPVTVPIELSTDGETWQLKNVLASAPVLAYLHIQGSPWHDVASGLTYRWPA